MSQLLLPGNATPSQVLSGSTFSAGSNFNTPGTMPNNGAVTLTPSGNGPVTIPAGYHNGSGSVAQVSVPAANVLTGTTIAGVAGTMPNKGAMTFTPSTANQGIPVGYHNGSGIVQGDANLVAANILSGKSIFGVAGNVIAGKQYASGSGTFDANYNANVSGLAFQPFLIIVEWTANHSVNTPIARASYLAPDNGVNYMNNTAYANTTSNYDYVYGYLTVGSPWTINANGFSLNSNGFGSSGTNNCRGDSGESFNWWAYQ